MTGLWRWDSPVSQVISLTHQMGQWSFGLIINHEQGKTGIEK